MVAAWKSLRSSAVLAALCAVDVILWASRETHLGVKFNYSLKLHCRSFNALKVVDGGGGGTVRKASLYS